MLEKAGIISQCVFPWSSPTVIMPQEAPSSDIPQTGLCVDNCTLNNLLPPVVKAHS